MMMEQHETQIWGKLISLFKEARTWLCPQNQKKRMLLTGRDRRESARTWIWTTIEGCMQINCYSL